LSSKTGLFAAAVAAFIISNYPLIPAPQLSSFRNRYRTNFPRSQQTAPPALNHDSSFHQTLSAIRVNIIWFLTLTQFNMCPSRNGHGDTRNNSKPKPRCTSAPGVPFPRRASIPSFSGRRGLAGTPPHNRLSFLRRSR
jgi:hypothetical protein